MKDFRRRPFRIEYGGDLDSQRGELIAGRDFRLGFEALWHYFYDDLPPRLVDLMRVGMAIYVVDRLVRRRRRPTRSWGRNLKVRVEVIDPDFWSGVEVLNALQQAAEFVSGDFWDFEFTGGSTRYEGTRPLLTGAFASESPLVCLYSGGLDSAAGLGLRVQECPERPIIPVTVWHQPRQEKLIGGQFGVLRDRFGARIDHLVVKAEKIRPSGSRRSKEEPSQRGRSMLFAAAGAGAAALSGVSEVEVFESGIGAINVPLMAGMVGSMATRGCHPKFLRLMSHLVSLVAEREITFRLPFLDRTKGEMVRALRDGGFADLARRTVSCARYPLGYRCYEPCGVCSACVFRRQAMLFGGVEEPMGTYSFDLFGTAEGASLVKPENFDDLKAFLMQAAEWTDIEITGRLPEAVERHLRDTRILKPGESPESIIALLARYREEWLTIANEGRRRGLPWARLLDRNLVGQGASHAIA